MAQILVLNGPNLNLLGTREPHIYGSETLADIEQKLQNQAKQAGISLEFRQTNAEHELVEFIHAARDSQVEFIIINPAAFTHTSVAIRDALSMLDVPIIEVHLSNIYRREPFRHVSYVADIATARVAGLGKRGYLIALEALFKLIQEG